MKQKLPLPRYGEMEKRHDPHIRALMSRPWELCPSTHCERAQECRSPSECSGTGKRVSR